MRTLSGVAALSITTDVGKLGRMQVLSMAISMTDYAAHARRERDWLRRTYGRGLS